MNGVRLMDVARAEWDKLKADVADICITLKGHARSKMPGLVDRVAENEGVLEKMVDERRTWKAMIKGFWLGLGINLLATIATLITVSKALSGEP